MQGKAGNVAVDHGLTAPAAEDGLRSMLSLFFVVHGEVLFLGASVSQFLPGVLF